jgi:outer membrane protein assembly factor BamB
MTVRSCARIAGCLVVGSVVALGAQAPRTDWPQWRGPNRDGSVPSFTPPKSWPDSLTMRWKVEVGIGYATPVLAGNRVYMFTRREDDEYLTALDAATGKQVWESHYAAPYTLIQAAKPHGLGPKSTPAYANGKLYTFGISGILSAFDAASGRVLWQKPAPAVGPTFSTSMSPLIDRGLLIVHVGGNNQGALTAFDPDTGNVRWHWDGDGPGYGSPVVAEFSGTRQVVAYTQRNIVGVSAETGELLWKRPLKTPPIVNALTPIVYGQTVIASGTDNGILALRISKQGNQWAAEEAWHNDDTFVQLSNLITVGDALFGLSPQARGKYFFLDAKTGKLLWIGVGGAANNAAIEKAGALLLVLDDGGNLLVADGSNPASGFTPLHRYKVADTATWAAPAISGNRLFVKDVSSLALWTVD